MKRLIILRHAKSDWGKEGLKDIDRHLNNRGYDDAYSQSAWLAAHHESPTQILSSSATRALSTALIFARALELDITNFIVEPAIYEAPIDSLLEILGRQDSKVDSILLAGHNPGLTDLWWHLKGIARPGPNSWKGRGLSNFINFQKTKLISFYEK